MTTATILKLIASLYLWMNTIVNPANPFNKAEMTEYFTPDCIMHNNGKLVIHNVEELYRHFMKNCSGNFSIQYQLPLKEIIISEDHKKCVVRYQATKTHPDKKVETYEVIAIWTLTNDGQFSGLDEVVYTDK